MKFSKTTWIAISGGVWFVVGVGLMTLGLRFIVQKAELGHGDTTSLIARLAPSMGGRDHAAMGLITVALLIGFMKGRFVLVKTVQRVVHRILSLAEPVQFRQVYGRGYLFLIGGMILLGMSLKWLPVPIEVRGAVDVAVGAALINGSMAYFRVAFLTQKTH